MIAKPLHFFLFRTKYSLFDNQKNPTIQHVYIYLPMIIYNLKNLFRVLKVWLLQLHTKKIVVKIIYIREVELTRESVRWGQLYYS